MPLAPDGIFRSQAWIDLDAKRHAIADAEAAVAAANAVLAEHRAEAERLEQIEDERLFSIKEKELISRRQAARARISSMVTVAEQLQTAIATTGRLWQDFQDELSGFNALCPPDFTVPEFSQRNLTALWDGELLRGTVGPGWALPHASLTSTLAEPLSDQIGTIGKAACEDLGHALGIRPKAARPTAAEEAA